MRRLWYALAVIAAIIVLIYGMLFYLGVGRTGTVHDPGPAKTGEPFPFATGST